MAKIMGFVLFLTLAFSGSVSPATRPAVQIAYWQKTLPHTSMPSAISDLISDDSGIHVSNINNAKSVHVSPGGVVVNTKHHKHHRIIVNVNPFYYIYAASDTQIHDDPRVTLFFLHKNLLPGTKFNLSFTKTTPGTAFIPRNIAASIPFSSSKLPQILNHFSIPPDSMESELIEKTLQECELPAMEGERKHCATSLESMVDFSVNSLGTNEVKVVSTKAANANGKKEYVVGGVEKMKGGKLVACHLEEYAYAVFYCHATSTSEAYVVKMRTGGGDDVEAVAVCHMDTGKWNPKHVAFRVLGVKPGSVPVCHFLPRDHVVWAIGN